MRPPLVKYVEDGKLKVFQFKRVYPFPPHPWRADELGYFTDNTPTTASLWAELFVCPDACPQSGESADVQAFVEAAIDADQAQAVADAWDAKGQTCSGSGD